MFLTKINLLKILGGKNNVLFNSLRLSSTNFHDAQTNLKKLREEPDNDVKLKLYGLFKQATTGDAVGSRPSSINFVARAKYDAHKEFYGITREEAEKKYIELVNSLLNEEEQLSSQSSTSSSVNVPGIDIIKEDKVYKITMNRPKKYNALTLDMYEAIGKALRESNEDNTTSVTVITGAGDYFSSGNDLSNFSNIRSKEDMKIIGEKASKIFNDFVTAFIDHNKPLIGLINGPAVGITVTTLAMYDYVIASDKATFETPFHKLALSAEGCSSYTFPLLMGHAKASEMLVFGKKLTANEAKERNLINEVVSYTDFKTMSDKKVQQISSLYPEAMKINKKLMRDIHREKLHEANKIEIPVLFQRFASKESMNAISKFFAKGN
ncbi:Enoyl-CoA delta isomerase 2, mitochondrial [Strongyloides ratti]|uniref:Enoyl-CoA delta isomerase 2, mitochondrial n=1 Tax=Strongyloides ratti TaxID=34506 RepID=A0A090L2D1_STRRB|nr:Enoyl-CoA delta isomerase 2, mitochondrial [Strongyloides ratti]CEF63986.1 Enoyl-CoA delta isomerase 2, mitochondrial [Strongyloides ratti]